MKLVAFLGCDGSGKSAVIREAGRALAADGVIVNYGHWRPKAFRGGGDDDAARGAADDPHGQAPRGPAASAVKLLWLWLNWRIGWRRDGRGGGVMMFDRYHADLLVDPRRYRYGGPLWLAKLACRLMPQPDAVFYLDADPEVLLSRKREVGEEALKQSREAYLDLAAADPRIAVIDASRPLDAVVADVLERLRRLAEQGVEDGFPAR